MIDFSINCIAHMTIRTRSPFPRVPTLRPILKDWCVTYPAQPTACNGRYLDRPTGYVRVILKRGNTGTFPEPVA